MSSLQDKAWFAKSCGEAALFPRNLVYHDTYEHNLNAYFTRLNERESVLFCKQNLSILDRSVSDTSGVNPIVGFHGACLRSLDGLKKHLSGGNFLERPDPKCRFFFIHAPNSREWLNTGRCMFTYALTYHQVMPSFLDFVFPFGRQEYARDFHFGGFRQESRMDPLHKGLEIERIGRSGREIRMSYSLKSVEQSDGQENWPWSIRQAAVYHSLDVETGAATWMIVKGNKLLKSRMEAITESQSFRNVNDFDTPARAFASSLALHLVICDWCSEDWRWYISFLEAALQNKTRRTLEVKLDSPSSPKMETPMKSLTWSTATSSNSEKRDFGSFDILEKPRPMTPPELPSGPPPRSAGRMRPTITMFAPGEEGPIDAGNFTFSDLQKVQYLEDKANEVLLILESNTTVLTELELHYHSVRMSEHWPDEFSIECRADTARFRSRIASILNDLRMQQARCRTLLRLLADRKSLLYGILDYRNSEASKLLATKAQQSTVKMELMTKDMHVIAQKTNQETVSMKIITLVTLFFLPGTFISVCEGALQSSRCR
ncbi:uncharacterized protein PAC_11991 [Phialocephala subalpina]|uniref:CorA-like transporter domain-containing protein n=1 Tax=Phialocephala subalpina TaxID=576137 RepID=A0A1L7XAP4_9HELO|nr:uncharacterized protein PAC_11991 [Phialocephala subalpina]